MSRVRKQRRGRQHHNNVTSLANPHHTNLTLTEISDDDDVLVPGTTFIEGFDRKLLQRTLTQYQYGDWERLRQISLDSFEGHPARARLSLLVASGHQQAGDLVAAREFVKLARNWGCNKDLIIRVLLAGTYNTLGRAAAVSGLLDKAFGLFEESVRVGMPGGEQRLIAGTRITEQLKQLNINTAEIVRSQTQPPNAVQLSKVWLYWSEGAWSNLVQVVDNAALPNHPDRAKLACLAAASYQQIEDVDGEQRCTQLALQWGASKKDMKELLMAGIHNRLGRAAAFASRYSESADYFLKAFVPLPQNQGIGIESALAMRIDNQLKDLDQQDIDRVKAEIELKFSNS